VQQEVTTWTQVIRKQHTRARAYYKKTRNF
jgi:hypothetical protein